MNKKQKNRVALREGLLHGGDVRRLEGKFISTNLFKKQEFSITQTGKAIHLIWHQAPYFFLFPSHIVFFLADVEKNL